MSKPGVLGRFSLMCLFGLVVNGPSLTNSLV
jgi:hypothetical protein